VARVGRLVGLSLAIKQQWLAIGNSLASNSLGIFLNLFGSQHTAMVDVAAVRELSALGNFLALPVKDAALVFGGVNLALLWLCTTASHESSQKWYGWSRQSNLGKPTWCFLVNI